MTIEEQLDWPAVKMLLRPEAEYSSGTLVALWARHPPASTDSTIPTLEPMDFLAFPVNPNVILKAISSFPKGSGG